MFVLVGVIEYSDLLALTAGVNRRLSRHRAAARVPTEGDEKGRDVYLNLRFEYQQQQLIKSIVPALINRSDPFNNILIFTLTKTG